MISVDEVKYFKDKDFGSKPNEDDIIRNGSKTARVIVALIVFHMVYIIFLRYVYFFSKRLYSF